MSIRLGNNIIALRANGQLSKTGAALTKVSQRLSSGLRITTASDDPAGLAIASSLNSHARVLNQGTRNLNDGISLLNIADATIDQLSEITSRLQELASQASNGSYNSTQRLALDTEAQALSQEFFRISRSAEFNGTGLFDGETQQLRLQSGYGVDGSITSSLGNYLGNGEFTSTFRYSVIDGSRDVILNDFNGDGHLDIASADWSEDLVSIAYGYGTGVFSSARSYTVGIFPEALVSGDYNNDGIFDIAAATFDGVSILLGDETGDFENANTYTAGSAPYGIHSADFNNDGNADIVTADASDDTVSVLLGNGDGTFGGPSAVAVGSGPSEVITGDVNGDGAYDIIAANTYDNDISVLLGDGNGGFGSRVDYATGNGPDGITLGDFNGDGHLDIATGNYSGFNISVLLGTGTGSFSAQQSYAIGSTIEKITAGDFNGDGHLDLATANYSENGVSVLLGTGTGEFADPNTYADGTANSAPYAVVSGDVNGDGVLDLITADYGVDEIAVHLGATREGIAPILPFSLQTIAESREALSLFAKKQALLSTQRASIGSFQSRLQVALAVTDSSKTETIAAAESITSADVAHESSELVRLSILQEAGVAVLANGKLQSRIALTLLEGL